MTLKMYLTEVIKLIYGNNTMLKQKYVNYLVCATLVLMLRIRISVQLGKDQEV